MIRRTIALAAVLGAAMVPAANGQDFRVGDLKVSRPWARATPGRARTGAAYMTILNLGGRVDRLVAVSAPVGRRAEVHTHLIENDVVRMRRVAALEVRPGEPTVLRPGGLHVMLMGLKAPLAEGGSFPLTLTFERAGAVTVEVDVLAIGAMGPGRRRGRGAPPS